MLKQQCAAVSATAIEKAIVELPENQQEAVRACFAAAKKKKIKGSRYTLNWIYECLLIRIKSKKVYYHSKHIGSTLCGYPPKVHNKNVQPISISASYF